MTWDGVPLAIGGGAVTQAETFRLAAYLASRSEGVATVGDCAVRPLAVPGQAVRVMPGGLTVLNRGAEPGGGQQMYVCRNPEAEVVALTPTSSGAGRTDLVAVVVRDPQYPGQPNPPSIENGPYVYTVIYEGVPANTETLVEVDPDQAGYALAKVTRPPSTGTITASHITDLRGIPNARVRQTTQIVNVPNSSDFELSGEVWRQFPQAASWEVYVPPWAVKVHLELYAASVRVINDNSADGNWIGRAKIKLGEIESADVELNPSIPSARRDVFSYIAAAERPIPRSMRGSRQTLESRARRSSSSSGVRVSEGYGTTVIVKATFFEEAAADHWVD